MNFDDPSLPGFPNVISFRVRARSVVLRSSGDESMEASRPRRAGDPQRFSPIMLSACAAFAGHRQRAGDRRSIEVGRQRRVAAVGEHAADLLRQDAAERQIRGDVHFAKPANFRRLVTDCGLAADPFAEEKDLVGGENAGRMSTAQRRSRRTRHASTFFRRPRARAT
jgi:hypothetical protein